MDNRILMKNAGSNHGMPFLRLLIIGQKRTGRSSLGNTLLGKNEFETWGGAANTVAHGVSEGRQLMVVDARGWGSEENTVPKQEKMELFHALSLCDPGPHVLLLVVQLLPFNRCERAVLQKRMELLTESVWRHTMVVFTLGEQLRGGSIMEYIQTSGEDLQWLMEKCRYRYGVINNKTPQDRRQVSGLLDRVENMVMENSEWHFSLLMYYRLEEEWNQREKQRMEREQKAGQKNRGLAVMSNQSCQNVLDMNDTLLKFVNHG